MSSEQLPATDAGAQAPAPDDTGAFQAYYRGASEPAHGVLYRMFVGWWRDRP